MGYEPVSHFYISDKYNPEEKVDIKTPNNFPDGNYMFVSSLKQAAAGKIYFSYDIITIYENENAKTISLDINGNDNSLAKLLSIIVQNKIITKVIIRPCSSSQGNLQTDLSLLKYTSYGTADITFAINIKKSSVGDAVTLTGTTVLISSTIEKMNLDLGDNAEVIIDEGNSLDFSVYKDGILNINTKALGGSVCKFKARNEDETYRTIKLTMKINKLISIEYESGE